MSVYYSDSSDSSMSESSDSSFDSNDSIIEITDSDSDSSSINFDEELSDDEDVIFIPSPVSPTGLVYVPLPSPFPFDMEEGYVGPLPWVYQDEVVVEDLLLQLPYQPDYEPVYTLYTEILFHLSTYADPKRYTTLVYLDQHMKDLRGIQYDMVAGPMVAKSYTFLSQARVCRQNHPHMGLRVVDNNRRYQPRLDNIGLYVNIETLTIRVDRLPPLDYEGRELFVDYLEEMMHHMEIKYMLLDPSVHDVLFNISIMYTTVLPGHITSSSTLTTGYVDRRRRRLALIDLYHYMSLYCYDGTEFTGLSGMEMEAVIQ